MSGSVWFNDGTGCFKTWQRPMCINNRGAKGNCLPQLEARDYELVISTWQALGAFSACSPCGM